MNQMIGIVLGGYILALSITGFSTMGVDKRRAEKGRWRIPERTLLLIALLGGGIGTYLGMRYFRHKTKHLSFRILLPAAAIADLLLIFYVIVKLIL